VKKMMGKTGGFVFEVAKIVGINLARQAANQALIGIA